MEDRFNAGGTRYLDPSGREITEEEYLRGMKKKANAGSILKIEPKEVTENAESTDAVSGKN